MKSRKLLMITLMASLFTFLVVGSAFAGGWHKLGATEQTSGANVYDPDSGLYASSWAAAQVSIPGLTEDEFVEHRKLPTSSNKCRTCHAVHNADNVGKAMGDGLDLNNDGDYADAGENAPTTGTGQNFKLLRNESRTSECYFCHGTSGALTNPVKKPYSPMIAADSTVIPAKGQHTLGATSIPDSTITSGNSIFTTGLSCGNCHSVHGGWTLNDVPNSGPLGGRILRRDPGNNGDRKTGGAASGVANVASQGGSNPDNTGGANEPILNDDQSLDATVTESQLLAAFCGDCHNKNVNWSTAGGVVNEGTRPNRMGHPLGNIDGQIDIYGTLGRVEDATVETWIKSNDSADNRMSCDDCHKSRRHQSELRSADPDPYVKSPVIDDPDNPMTAAQEEAKLANEYGKSKFPHQSVGHKLMSDAYTDASSVSGFDYTGDPNRVLPSLDRKVCRTCHGEIGSFGGIGNPSNSNTF